MKKLQKVRQRVEAMTFRTGEGELNEKDQYTVTLKKDDTKLGIQFLINGNRVNKFTDDNDAKAKSNGIELNDVVVEMTFGNESFKLSGKDAKQKRCDVLLDAWRKLQKKDAADKDIKVSFTRPEVKKLGKDGKLVSKTPVRRRLCTLDRLLQEIRKVEC